MYGLKTKNKRRGWRLGFVLVFSAGADFVLLLPTDDGNLRQPSGSLLFLLMTILSETFFAFVGSHLVAFSFLSAGHSLLYALGVI